MRKTAVLMIVIISTVLASAAMADDEKEGKLGRLFLFQKCDESLAGSDGYDSSGCPVISDQSGPWPILPHNRRWGQMHYNLLGDEFKFSFEGKRLPENERYTLIYYPDPWPGQGLICLGSGTTNDAGNIQIHGRAEIPSGLPVPDDANFHPINPSGAVGAKIWLVLSDDVECDTESTTPQMIGWRPWAYLFEGNLIVYQYSDLVPESDEDDKKGKGHEKDKDN